MHYGGGGLWLIVTIQSAVITIESTDFVDNHRGDIGDNHGLLVGDIEINIDRYIAFTSG